MLHHCIYPRWSILGSNKLFHRYSMISWETPSHAWDLNDDETIRTFGLARFRARLICFVKNIFEHLIMTAP